MSLLSSRRFRTLAGVAVIALAAGGARVVAQQGDAPAERGPNPLNQNLPLLIEQTEGCLGVELAQTMTGKNVIFAWFENKEAALRWYWSKEHVEAMKFAGFEAGTHEPMADVPSEGPILVIASIVQTDNPADGDGLGVSQIAIELYQPLPGGAYFGGRFAPDAVKVKGLTDYSEE